MFMALHHGMHLRQCEAVIDTPGFPRSADRQSLTADEYLQPRDRKPWLKQAAGSTKRVHQSVSKQKSESAKNRATVKKQPAGAKKPSGKKTTAKR
jgi:hypothetical protein